MGEVGEAILEPRGVAGGIVINLTNIWKIYKKKPEIENRFCDLMTLGKTEICSSPDAVIGILSVSWDHSFKPVSIEKNLYRYHKLLKCTVFFLRKI